MIGSVYYEVLKKMVRLIGGVGAQRSKRGDYERSVDGREETRLKRSRSCQKEILLCAMTVRNSAHEYKKNVEIGIQPAQHFLIKLAGKFAVLGPKVILIAKRNRSLRFRTPERIDWCRVRRGHFDGGVITADSL